MEVELAIALATRRSSELNPTIEIARQSARNTSVSVAVTVKILTS